MREEIVRYGLEIIPFVITILTFLLVWGLYGTHEPRKKILSTYQEIKGLLREKKNTAPYYLRQKLWLSKNGASYHYGKKITPESFLVCRWLLAVSGMLAFSTAIGNIVFVVGGLFFFLPVWLLTYLNRRDNERLLPELKLVYNALELQIRAGVYVTDALAECYESVQERRLREALLDLTGDIVLRADIYEAMERFQSRFDNRYIDSLCITILQALESGQAVEVLSDMGEQIRHMEQTVLARKKAALDRSLTFYQLGILVVVLGLALYACVVHMLGAVQIF